MTKDLICHIFASHKTKINGTMKTINHTKESIKAKRTLILLGLFENKKKHNYNPDYVARIRKAEKEPFIDIDLSDYGIIV